MQQLILGFGNAIWWW